MKKNYAIITEDLECNPGIYGVNVTEEQTKKFQKGTSWGDSFQFDFGDLFLLPFGTLGILGGIATKTLYKKFIKTKETTEIIKNKEIRLISKFPKKEDCITDTTNLNFERPYIDKGILIPSSFLNQSYELYNDKIFHGAFKKKEDLQRILPNDDDFYLYILSKKHAQTLFNGNIQEGLHVIDLEYNSLFPVSTYQKSKWDIYQEAIISVFSYLGAKKLIIKEEKVVNVGASADFSKSAYSASTTAKSIINCEWSSEEPIYNIEIAQRNLHLLKEISLFYNLALSLVEQKRSMNIKKTEIVSFTFGVNADILSCFQGESHVILDKELYIEFSF